MSKTPLKTSTKTNITGSYALNVERNDHKTLKNIAMNKQNTNKGKDGDEDLLLQVAKQLVLSLTNKEPPFIVVNLRDRLLRVTLQYNGYFSDEYVESMLRKMVLFASKNGISHAALSKELVRKMEKKNKNKKHYSDQDKELLSSKEMVFYEGKGSAGGGLSIELFSGIEKLLTTGKKLAVKHQKKTLFDAILVTPDKYGIVQELADKHKYLEDYAFYFETFFDNGKHPAITPEELAKKQNEYARSIDHRILPDIRGDMDKSLKRYEKYLKHYNGVGRLVIPLQQTTMHHAVEKLVDTYDGVIAIPFALFSSKKQTKTVKSPKQPLLIKLINRLVESDYDYHLLGFTPINKWSPEIFRKAYSFDSQAVLPFIKKYPSMFFPAKNDATWRELDTRLYNAMPPPLEVRIIMYYSLLRMWVEGLEKHMVDKKDEDELLLMVIEEFLSKKEQNET